MTNRALPVIFLNLSGEMLYILNQRLHAQKIASDKATKVMHDIVSTMFNRRFIEEMFKPQAMYSKSSMRMLFDRLAHASIMRLNTASMDKLYDLMTMAVKYQVTMCLRPSDLLLVTLNHMDSVMKYVEPKSAPYDLMQASVRLLLQTYEKLNNGQWQTLRQQILNFFQDIHIRVSIFLKDKNQSSNGRFIHPLAGPLPNGVSTPGLIRMFNDNGLAEKSIKFHISPPYSANVPKGSTGVNGDRVTKLGLNMYNAARPVEVQPVASAARSPAPPASAAPSSNIISDIESMTPNPNAKAQLDLLSSLIGGGGDASPKPASSSSNQFRLNLFNSEEEEAGFANQKPMIVNEPGSQVVTIDASKTSKNPELSRIMGELNVQDSSNSQDLDLLDLMDNA